MQACLRYLITEEKFKEMGKSVVVLTYGMSVVEKTIEKDLQARGFEVSRMADDPEAVKRAIESTDVFIAYLPDEVFEEKDAARRLLLVSRELKSAQRNLIIIADEENMPGFVRAVPNIKSFPRIPRPVDMADLLKEIEKEIKNSERLKSLKKILVIDDDPLYATTVCEWLKTDYRMTMITDGKQAIRFLETDRVDLILLDYCMPGLDGSQVFEILKNRPETESIPVIFLTGAGNRENFSKIISLGPQGYVLKSTNREGLLKILRDYLGE